MRQIKVTLLLFTLSVSTSMGWGFFAHKQINRHAIFTLPPPILNFYKHYIHFITEHAVDPDKRRYVVEGEASKHYIDIDYYGPSALYKMPRYWHQALAAYPMQALVEHGILPWYIYRMKHKLTKAFQQKDLYQILKLSADIGHYIADAHVPLHTSMNYDGQFTNQQGIHGLWESRLPELFLTDYNFFVGKAEYLNNPQQRIWEAIITAHKGVDKVLSYERKLSESFPSIKKYSFEQRGGTLQKVYSIDYARAYHNMLEGQVERQARAAIKMIGAFWLTCWVDAGQPDLGSLLSFPLQGDPLEEHFPKQKRLKVHDCGE